MPETTVKKDLFRKKAAAAPKKADDKPIINLTDPALVEMIHKALAHKREADDHTAMFGTCKDQVVAAVRPMHQDLCGKLGDAVSTVALHVDGRPVAKFTSQCQYTACDLAREEELRAVFDEAEYARYFKEEMVITMKKESGSNPDVRDTLVEKLGEEFVEKHFDVKAGIKPTPALHADLAIRPDIRERARPLLDGGLIRQYVPSVAALGDK